MRIRSAGTRSSVVTWFMFWCVGLTSCTREHSLEFEVQPVYLQILKATLQANPPWEKTW